MILLSCGRALHLLLKRVVRDEWDYGTLNVESECVCCWEEGDGDGYPYLAREGKVAEALTQCLEMLYVS